MPLGNGRPTDLFTRVSMCLQLTLSLQPRIEREIDLPYKWYPYGKKYAVEPLAFLCIWMVVYLLDHGIAHREVAIAQRLTWVGIN